MLGRVPITVNSTYSPWSANVRTMDVTGRTGPFRHRRRTAQHVPHLTKPKVVISRHLSRQLWPPGQGLPSEFTLSSGEFAIRLPNRRSNVLNRSGLESREGGYSILAGGFVGPSSRRYWIIRRWPYNTAASIRVTLRARNQIRSERLTSQSRK